jgi:hypothetical protein
VASELAGTGGYLGVGAFKAFGSQIKSGLGSSNTMPMSQDEELGNVNQPGGIKISTGSTGRTYPHNFYENYAMENVKADPTKGRVLPIEMTDTRWPANKGWVKMSQNIKYENGIKVEIHYVMNTITGEVADFKFK